MTDEGVLSRNNVRVTGAGPAGMIFAHGFGCDQTMWRWVAPAFADRYRVVLYDHVGSGKSDLTAYSFDKYGTLQGYADDLAEICRATELRDAVFVGHSVSSMIGLLAANRYAGLFSRLIMVGPSPRFVNDGEYRGGFEQQDIEELLVFLDANYLGWSAVMGPAIMGNLDRPALAEELTNSFCRTDPDIARHFARVTFLSDCREEVPRARVPSLLLQCREDAVAPLEVGEYLQRTMPGSTLVVMEATGHCPHMSAPAETVAAMEAYLASA